jgi:predicted 3-demethylubiquinone-9 3-methyltransferase (glyoxalase superfamily)
MIPIGKWIGDKWLIGWQPLVKNLTEVVHSYGSNHIDE